MTQGGLHEFFTLVECGADVRNGSTLFIQSQASGDSCSLRNPVYKKLNLRESLHPARRDRCSFAVHETFDVRFSKSRHQLLFPVHFPILSSSGSSFLTFCFFYTPYSSYPRGHLRAHPRWVFLASHTSMKAGYKLRLSSIRLLFANARVNQATISPVYAKEGHAARSRLAEVSVRNNQTNHGSSYT
jgi:hypothetical protein